MPMTEKALKVKMPTPVAYASIRTPENAYILRDFPYQRVSVMRHKYPKDVNIIYMSGWNASDGKYVHLAYDANRRLDKFIYYDPADLIDKISCYSGAEPK
jgi:hypothetical protein